jgi:uncharacterized protein
MARERPTDPLAAPVAALCRAGETLLGAWLLAELPRLAASLWVPPSADERVGWQARFGQVQPAAGPPQQWLELEAHTHIALQCQRCLQGVQQPLALERRFRGSMPRATTTTSCCSRGWICAPCSKTS